MPDGATFAWPPRVLPERAAAYYLGLSPSTFRAEVRPVVAPIRLTAGRVGWVREDLDAWVESRRPGAVAVDQAQPAAEAGAGGSSDAAIADALAALGRKAQGRAPRTRPAGGR